MPVAWRIVKAKHAATAFTGEGAAKSGGRWNSRGVPVVYASGSRALAVLETLVHINPPIHFDYVIIPVEFDAALVEQIDLNDLPQHWQCEPPGNETKLLGDLWVRSKRSVVLALPSAIIPSEANYLLNPAHTDFCKVSIGKSERFSFDPRLTA